MSWRTMWSRLRGTRERDALEREMEAEMQFHLEMSAKRNERRGMTAREARRRAAVQFGGIESFKEEGRGAQRALRLEYILGDARQALRGLRRSPSFATAAILTIALGVAINTSVFSVVNGVLLRPLPLPDPDEIVYAGWNWGPGSGRGPALTGFQFEFMAANTKSLRAVAIYRTSELQVGEEADAQPIAGLLVSDQFFDVIGVRPVQGREFDAVERAPGGPDVVILGDGVWRAHFGGEPQITGRSVVLNGKPHRVIGVMPASYRMTDVPNNTGFILPYRFQADPADEGHNHLTMARTRSGWSAEQVAADFAALSRSFHEQYPELAKAQEGFEPWRFDEVFVRDMKFTLWILQGAVTLVLLIACANTATLLLVRATGRQRDLAVRASLGAGRMRLLQQLLTEGVVLALIASALGLVLSTWGVRALLAVAPGTIPRIDEIGVDGRVLGYTLLISIVTGIVFGLTAGIPALRFGLHSSLRAGGRGTTGSGARVRDLLVVAETAFAVVLLTGAVLLIVSFARLTRVDPGFEPEAVAAVRLGKLPPQYAEESARKELERQALERLRELPGVVSVAAAGNFPLERGLNFPVDTPERPDLAMGAVELRSITPGYFQTLGIPLRAGRAFTEADTENSGYVAIVNDAFARRWWPGENAIGKTIQVGHFKDRWIMPGLDHPTIVVGVVADMHEIQLNVDPRPTVLLPRAQMSEGGPAIMVRGEAVDALLPSIRNALEELDPRLSPQVEAMTEIVGRSVAYPRFRMILLGVFAAAALLLAAIGIYGVIASGVQHRTREIGLRMALGATGNEVALSIMRRGLALVGAGVVVGIPLAVGLARFLAGSMFGTSTTDPIAFGAVLLVFGLIGGVAGFVPARRAARVSPAIALHAE